MVGELNNNVGQERDKLWELYIPHSFLYENHMIDIDAEMGDEGMMIYFRLLLMAVKSCGIIRFKNMRVSSLTRLAGRLSNRYTEEEIERVLEILDENDMIEINDEGDQIYFKDALRMAHVDSRHVTEKQIQQANSLFDELWSDYIGSAKKHKHNVTLEAKLKLLEIGKEKCSAALEEYKKELCTNETSYTNAISGHVFFNEKIFSYVENIEDKFVKQDNNEDPEFREMEYKAEKLLEKLWSNYFGGYKRGKRNISMTTRFKLLQLGADKCLEALEAYKKDVKECKIKYPSTAGEFFSKGIFSYIQKIEEEKLAAAKALEKAEEEKQLMLKKIEEILGSFEKIKTAVPLLPMKEEATSVVKILKEKPTEKQTKKRIKNRRPDRKEGCFLYKYVVSDEIIYFGVSKDIITRVHQHGSGKGLDEKFVPYLSNAEIFVHECSTRDEMMALESLLIDTYKPILNEKKKTNARLSFPITEDKLSWKRYEENDYRILSTAQETQMPLMNKAG